MYIEAVFIKDLAIEITCNKKKDIFRIRSESLNRKRGDTERDREREREREKREREREKHRERLREGVEWK